MKIAVATKDNMVAQHFGYCDGFHVFDVEDNKIVKEEMVANPGHKPGFLPNYLGDLGVNVIVSGGMGGGAVEIFNERGIQVIIGVEGNPKAVVAKFIEGQLVSTGSVCEKHEH